MIMQIWNDGKLIRDFVPLVNFEGKMRLYDLVNKQFYYDLNGNNFTYETRLRNGGDE